MPKTEELKKILSERISEGRLSHAVLFEGEKGMGKRELALWLAKAILCRGENPPCEKCSVCRKITAGNHPDVETVEGKDSARGFPIEKVREIKESLWLAPNEAEQKIYILPNIQNMSAEAENALLKTLEEPPEHARFIMTCDNAQKLLDTIISRVTVYKIEAPTGKECAEYLCDTFSDLSTEDAMLFSMAYAKNPGRAREAYENGRLDLIRLAVSSPDMLRKGKAFDLAAGLSEMASERNTLAEFFDIFGNIVGTSAVMLAKGEKPPIRITGAQAVKTMETITHGKETLMQNCSTELVQSWFCMELLAVFGGII